ncbi:pilus assembly protein TadG-related protein [Algiphilus sp. W345]|uniref:Pilus assembly protein TadG-related protein n=1 Tax=Banduia mediterranea TaxID=3075609 RepID=A0ABU2WKK9_9GAMM|nr:pilus assembly protein TadG-related protein [Algiphilus sp. W345]MDT0498055.1 pilus assembly protein TadG-related protein [Algiphilus sp. W345]
MEYGYSLHGRHRQRGAVAVIAGIGLIAMLSAVFLALDIGNLYFAKRVLQKQADMAALDASRAIARCDGTEMATKKDVEDNIKLSLETNGASWTTLEEGGSFFEVGKETSSAGSRTFTLTDIDEADAVYVELHRPFPRRFFPFPTEGSSANELVVYASARQIPQVAMSVGSTLLSLDTTQSILLNALLGTLLRTDIQLDVASYHALADASVTLGSIAVELGLATSENDPRGINSLLTTDIELPLLLNAIATTLDVTVGAVDLLVTRGIVENLADVVDPSITVSPGNVVIVENGLEGVVGALPINVLELLRGLAEGGAEGIPVAVDLSAEALKPLLGPLSAIVGSLADLQVSINIIEPSQIAAGAPGYFSDGAPRVRARTSQVAIVVNANLLSILNPAALLGADGAGAISLAVVVEAAQAESVAEAVQCQDLHHPEPAVDVLSKTATLRAGIGAYLPGGAAPEGVDSLEAPTKLISLSLLGLPILKLGLADPVIVSVIGNEGIADTVEGPYPAATEASADSALSPLVSDLIDSVNAVLADGGLVFEDPSLLGGVLWLVLKLLDILHITDLLNVLTNFLVDLLTPLLTAIDSLVFALLDLLGISIADVDVTIQSLEVKQPLVFTHSPMGDQAAAP